MTTAAHPPFFPYLCSSQQPREAGVITVSSASAFVLFRCHPEAQSGHLAQKSQAQLLHKLLESQLSVPGLSPLLATGRVQKGGDCVTCYQVHPAHQGSFGGAGLPMGCP